MKWKTILLLSVAIVLIASGIVLYTMDKPRIIKLSGLHPLSDPSFVIPVKLPPLVLSPPLYAQLWFVPLLVGVAILGFLGFKRFKL